MTTDAFIDLSIGAQVTAKGRIYRITRHIAADSVLAEDTRTGNVERLHVDAVRPTTDPPNEGNDADVTAGPDITQYSAEDWAEAQRRFEVIKPLLELDDRRRVDVEGAAQKAGAHPSTVYHWLSLYLQSRYISALIPQKRGPNRGDRRLSPEVERIVDATIRDLYLQRQRGRPQHVANEVKRRCYRAELTPPHPNTVRNRIQELRTSETLRSQGRKQKARDQYEPIRGEFPGAEFPLAVVQIDHTRADVIIVEEQSRQPMGRPWITLAIDVFSRMVVGAYVSIEAPNATAAGICTARAMLPKGDYLASLGVPGDWPAWGRIGTIHADNAKEFRSRAFGRACEQYGINLQMRPVKRPHYGGHVERLMGTSANAIHALPGATFSSPKEREGYNSEREAALTLAEFERHLVDFIVNVYHKREHSALGTSPERQWELGIVGDGNRPGTGLPEIPADPARVWVDFLPYVERTVQRYGIVIDDVHYYHEVLNRWINAVDPKDPKKKRRFIVRRNPLDISGVYFYDPDAERYYLIPYRSMNRPAISVWELHEAQRQARAEGRRHVDEEAIFRAVERMRERVEEAQAKTKAARRSRHRANRIRRAGSKSGTPVEPPTPQPPAQSKTSNNEGEETGEGDIFSEPVEPFSDLGDPQ